jgi:uncharacterized membrane protein YraQ (UPF0718 family)
MLDLISNIILSVVVAALAGYVFKLRRDKKRLLNSITKITLDNFILKSELEKAVATNQDNAIEKTDGFLKFVSDSRDWAFKYIEEVQEGLSKFTSRVGPTLKYLNTYGTAVEGPHDESIKIISEAYKELESLLPEDKK